MIQAYNKTNEDHRVSVVVPALNESATIASIVRYALRSHVVGEVIVVDDGSTDGTPEIARGAGAKVITSTLLGKGASMEDGMRAAENEFILYLDGDLKNLADDVIELMTVPLFANEVDFVKARFTRAAGRVTMLTAKPLLKTYFPELAHLHQPLSGIMAARKTLLQELVFENDYGVDIGLLLDAACCHARITEVDIGYIEHRNHPLETLGEMATQVARALLDRAAKAGRLRRSFVQEVKEKEKFDRAQLPCLLERVPNSERLALFDMDGVLLNGRFTLRLAEATNRVRQLIPLLDNYAISPGERMKRIGQVFAGVPREEFERVAREIPLMPGAVETVIALRKMGYRVGLVTESYFIAAETVRRRVFADFSFANMMRFKNGKSTGRVVICPAMIHQEGCEAHDHCKANVVRYLKEKFSYTSREFLAVGDGFTDICMLREAGCSIAFRPRDRTVRSAAQFQAWELSQVMDIARIHHFGNGARLGGDMEADSCSLSN